MEIGDIEAAFDFDSLMARGEQSSWWGPVSADWKQLTMGAAIILQTINISYSCLSSSIFSLFAQCGILGSLVLGSYYAQKCSYLQSFQNSAQQLAASNAELQKKIESLENAANHLIVTIARFDEETANYLAKQNTEITYSVEKIHQATAAFSRVLSDQSLSDLWRETLAALTEYQKAKAEYDQIRQAIAIERVALSQLHENLEQVDAALKAKIEAFTKNEEKFRQLYQEYERLIHYESVLK